MYESMKTLPILFIIAFLCCLPLFGETPVDERTIRGLVAEYARAREHLDPGALQALFTPDADQLVSSGAWRHGREQLISGMLESSRRNSGERSIDVERIRFISDDVAIADARYVIKGREGAGDRRMWSTFVAVRSGEEWRIAAIRNMLPAR